jgi:L-glutamine-phosphate cytidylyltransferase
MTACRQAIVLAAGEGKRLRPLTERVPKCLVPVAGRPMLDRLFDALEANLIADVVIVTGHLHAVLRDHVSARPRPFSVRYVHNDAYDRTNNVYSLWLARESIRAPFLLAESDVVVEPRALAPLSAPDRMAVARWDPRLSGTVVRVRDDSSVERMILKRDQNAAMDLGQTWKTVNFYSFSEVLWSSAYRPALDETVTAGRLDDYYEASLADLINEGAARLEAVDFSGQRWMEIDDLDDLAIAETLFAQA